MNISRLNQLPWDNCLSVAWDVCQNFADFFVPFNEEYAGKGGMFNTKRLPLPKRAIKSSFIMMLNNSPNYVTYLIHRGGLLLLADFQDNFDESDPVMEMHVLLKSGAKFEWGRFQEKLEYRQRFMEMAQEERDRYMNQSAIILQSIEITGWVEQYSLCIERGYPPHCVMNGTTKEALRR